MRKPGKRRVNEKVIKTKEIEGWSRYDEFAKSFYTKDGTEEWEEGNDGGGDGGGTEHTQKKKKKAQQQLLHPLVICFISGFYDWKTSSSLAPVWALITRFVLVRCLVFQGNV